MPAPSHLPTTVGNRRALAEVLVAVLVLGLLVVGIRAVARATIAEPPSGPVPSVAEVGDPTRLSCPDPSELPDEGAELPEGAVTLRLCSWEAETEVDFRAPSTVLTSGVDDVVRLINRQGVPEGDGCGGVGTVAYSLALGYADGSVRAVNGDPGGCDAMTVGGLDQLGAEEVLDDVLDRLRRQRAAQQPMSAPGLDVACAAGADYEWTLGVEPDELVRGVLCVHPPDLEQPVRQAPLSPADARFLAAAAAREDEEGGCGQPARAYVVGVNAFGDPVTSPIFQCQASDGDAPRFTEEGPLDGREVRLLETLAAIAQPVGD